jgi:hypothetical protein
MPTRLKFAILSVIGGKDKVWTFRLARVVNAPAADAWPEGRLRSSEASGLVLPVPSLRISVAPRVRPNTAIPTESPFILEIAHSFGSSPLGVAKEVTKYPTAAESLK